MNRLLLISAAFCCVFASSAFARQGMVTLKDGQKIEGDIRSDTPAEVVVSIRGIETTVARDRIQSLAYLDSPAEEFQKKLDALKPDDAAGRIALARWAFDNRLYTQSRDLLDQVLEKVDPNNAEAAELRKIVVRQIELERRTENQPPRPDTREQTDAPGAPGRPPVPSADNLLTATQIMQIKIQEANALGEPGLRLKVPDDIRRNITKSRADISGKQFEIMPALAKLDLVTQAGTPEDLERVELVGDPAALADFSRRIQPIVLAGCATAGCHNTPEAGNFMLFERATNEQTTYTNFYILQQYAKQVPNPGGGGTFSAPTLTIKMLDRLRPQDSLLAQYMLPANQTTYSHPVVNGYRAMARDKRDPRYQDVVRWISSLKSIEQNYQINYTPPQKAVPASQPADEPKQ